MFSESLAITGAGSAVAYTAWPLGQRPVTFGATHVGDRTITFANPTHDFPRELVYDGSERGVLAVGLTGVGPDGPRELSWRLRGGPTHGSD